MTCYKSSCPSTSLAEADYDSRRIWPWNASHAISKVALLPGGGSVFLSYLKARAAGRHLYLKISDWKRDLVWGIPLFYNRKRKENSWAELSISTQLNYTVSSFQVGHLGRRNLNKIGHFQAQHRARPICALFVLWEKQKVWGLTIELGV